MPRSVVLDRNQFYIPNDNLTNITPSVTTRSNYVYTTSPISPTDSVTNTPKVEPTISPSNYLDLTGKHYLCPPATLNNYKICENTHSTCGNDRVDIYPLHSNSLTHFGCTNPKYPPRGLESCPEGYVLYDQNTACVNVHALPNQSYTF